MVRRCQRGMQSSNLDCTHKWMSSGVAFYRLPCAARMVERHGALDAIIALGQHTRSDDVKRGMQALSLRSTDGWTTSGVVCHHHPLTTHTIGLRRAWHAIIALGKHTQSDNVGRGILLSPFERINDRTTSRMACYRRSSTTHMV